MALTDTLMIHCRKATEFVERRDLQPLSMGERAGLWFHMRICKYCQAYAKQSEAIDLWMEERVGTRVDTVALEDRILARLKG